MRCEIWTNRLAFLPYQLQNALPMEMKGSLANDWETETQLYWVSVDASNAVTKPSATKRSECAMEAWHKIMLL